MFYFSPLQVQPRLKLCFNFLNELNVSIFMFWPIVKRQAGTELGQAQIKLELGITLIKQPVLSLQLIITDSNLYS